jgi:peptidoglycan-associated lipoprotein
MNRKLSLLVVMAMALVVSACSGKKEQVVQADSSTGSAAVDDNNAYNSGYSKAYLESLGIIGDPINYKTVYFEYNSSAIDERSSIIASAHARNLASNPANVTLEGHADERGTRDYNLALGERRAAAVSSLMASVGTGNSNINTISYGEERPVDAGHNEAAWQQNRRVQIVY